MRCERARGKLLQGGSFAVRTGTRTGRSPEDKFIVRTTESAEQVCWGAHNQPMEPATFEHLKARLRDYLRNKALYVQDCTVSQDPAHRRSVRVITEQAYHSLFARTMFIPNDETGLELGAHEPADLTIVHAPFLELGGHADGIQSDAVIALHLQEGLILIAGTAYAGELKKAVFTAMNYYLPLAGALSLHSAANLDPQSGKTAFFLGLSGTGKTTLSTDPERVLIGDDEHAWTESGIFNIEGGCYAKVIRLSREAEPVIFATTHAFGTLLENVVFAEDGRAVDLDDDSVTENTRGSYPLSMLRNAYTDPVAPHPSHVILLTADASGVLPPMARLTYPQALYHFLSGYTSKLAGTETGDRRTRGDLQPLLRGAVHGAESSRLFGDAAGPPGADGRRGLADQHGLGRRPLGGGRADRDRRHARDGARHPERSHAGDRDAPRPRIWVRGAAPMPRSRRPPAPASRPLAGRGGLRPAVRSLGRALPRALRAVPTDRAGGGGRRRSIATHGMR